MAFELTVGFRDLRVEGESVLVWLHEPSREEGYCQAALVEVFHAPIPVVMSQVGG